MKPWRAVFVVFHQGVPLATSLLSRNGADNTSPQPPRRTDQRRLEKELEDAGIKLSSVATDILGRSGRAMLQALIDGERDTPALAEMARARMRTKMSTAPESGLWH